MAIESINNPIVIQPGIEPISGNERAPAAPMETSPHLISDLEGDPIQPLNAFSLQSMSFSGTDTIDPGNDLITFSSLAEAKKWAGDDVDTVYFKKHVENGVTYLVPLKAIRSKEVSYSNIGANKLQFAIIGDPVPFTQALPKSSEFLKLHSLEQTALVSLFGTSQSVPYPPPKTGTMSYTSLTFPAQGDEAAVTAVLSQDQRKIYIVEKLQARDFSFMTYADQLAISKTDAFNEIKETLGLSGTTAQAIKAIDEVIAYIKHPSKFPDNATTITVGITGLNPPDYRVVLPGRIGFFTLEERDLFLEQLELIRDEVLNDMAVFNMTAIKDKTKEVQDRFDRALAFGNLPVRAPKVDDPSYAVYRYYGGNSGVADATTSDLSPEGGVYHGYLNLISSDNNKTVKEGFDLFIAQERIQLENAKSRRELVKNIMTDNMILDAPTLLYRLQLHYNISAEASIACASEEIRQQNDLLNSYNKAQKLISITIGVNDKSYFLGRNNGEKKTIINMSPEEARDISMFMSVINHAGNATPLHPLEVLRKISRPRFDIYSSGGWGYKQNAAVWQQYGNQLSEATNLLSQETQSALNKVNGLEKEKARYTDMASNTLSKLNEILISIGRSL